MSEEKKEEVQVETPVKNNKGKKKKKKNKNLIQDVEVDPLVIEKFNLVYSNKLRYAIYKLDEDETKIILDSVATESSDTNTLKEQLPDNEVRWIILSLSYKLTDNSVRKKILFVAWVPDSIKRESHKETIRVKSLGIFHQGSLHKAFNGKSMKKIQGNDYSDIEEKSLLLAVSSFGEQINFETLWK
mmetsp:Transcript_16671/g.14943  ORF Transcript_16671/g.14943 Transcript_16671/m.14943 type:complete len:186 (-) Transcript_16671:217-774(-)|eukprot:CAMPEP_0201568530 /NCGR_PEP_ID=MMETSP0190_2-20130828/9665_1 /ASSEMBLY_ACC=CAM_ASM_000263 /TAXON_ID=37353 /ORGANISM="Rosalina sp." /LENGTH=185 /DNA_ID=CAMNT_0047989755 /DNA_START=59 /DNA_END=616 /DNA_ORIENTATION=-